MNTFYPRPKRGEHIKASANEAMTDILGRMGFDPSKFAVFEAWDKEIRGLIRNCEAVALQGNRLCVRVPSVVHRQELMYSKDRLVRRLNQAMGQRLITDIKFELSAGTNNNDRKGGQLRAQNPRQWNQPFGERRG